MAQQLLWTALLPEFVLIEASPEPSVDQDCQYPAVVHHGSSSSSVVHCMPLQD
jgi:hypothetical protein